VIKFLAVARVGLALPRLSPRNFTNLAPGPVVVQRPFDATTRFYRAA